MNPVHRVRLQVAAWRGRCACCWTKDHRTEGGSAWCSLCKYWGTEGCPRKGACRR